MLILGIRQIGKSTITKQLAFKYIKEKNLKAKQFLNLDLRVSIIKDAFLDIMYDLSPEVQMVVIDEIQLLRNWNYEMQSIIDKHKNVKFIITGSNSLFLKSDNFVGRATQYIMNSLNFKEFQLFWQNLLVIILFLVPSQGEVIIFLL